MLKKWFFLSLLVQLLFAQSYAEIERIMITWTPALCNDTCVKSLKEQFYKVNGVAEVLINQPAGQADLRWKPNVPLTYNALRLPLAMIGLYPKVIRVRVRGMIRHDSRSVTLVSVGDGTPFVLLSPVRAPKNRYVERNSVYVHLLSVDLREEFLQAETNHQIVVIEGPLFEPYRTPNLELIVEDKSISNPKPDQTQR